MSLEYARLVWCCYGATSTDLTVIPTLNKQEALTHPASPTITAAMFNDELRAGHLHSGSAVHGGGEDWTLGDLDDVDAEERVGMKRRLYDLQRFCPVKMRKVPKSVVEAAELAVELVEDAAGALLGADEVADQRIDDLSG